MPSEKRRATVTAQKHQQEALNQEIERKTSEEVAAIFDKHRCVTGSCQAGSMPCFIHKDQHIKLHYKQVKQWARAIVNGEATTTEPPTSLRSSLERAAEDMIAKKRQKSKKPAVS